MGAAGGRLCDDFKRKKIPSAARSAPLVEAEQ